MVQAIPEGVPNVVPYLCIRGAAKAIDFYKAAFGAELISSMPMGEGLVGHAELKIGATRVYLADEMPIFAAVQSPKTLKGSSFNVHLWVDDCDAVFAQALKAGAKVAMPLTDQFWGDRYGMVVDPFGHVWAITTHKEDLTPEEMMRRGDEAMKAMAQQAPKAGKAKDKAKAKAKPKPSKAEKEKAKAAKKQAKEAKKAEKAQKKEKKKKKKSKH